jgi:FKBP-type peptidyl-prolyl cis-trans isomerase SlyD
MKIEKNCVVSIEYELVEVGESDILDSNKGQEPLNFIVGKDHIIPGLESQLLNLEKGKNIDIKVDSADAYGEVNPEALDTLPREQFADIELDIGMQLYGQSENGESVAVTVVEFDDTNVTIDHNHPLAGKDLMFSVSIIDVREATDDELISGQIGGNMGDGTCNDESGEGCGCK